MKNAIKSVILVSLLAISVTAIAQQGQGGGRGQGGMMQGRGGMMGGPASLINRTDVQADLQLTDAMKAELTKHQEKQREEQRAMFENMRNGGGGMDREAMQKMMTENQAKNEAAIKAIIGEAKWKRLTEINIQLQGNRAILDPKVQEALGFDDGQKAAVKALQEKQMEAAASLREKMQNQEIDREQMQEISRKNSETLNTELGKVLKGDQAEKLKAMGGAPFKATEQPRGGRGGGGGGR